LKNSLSLTLCSLQDAVAANPGAKTWGPGVQVVEELGSETNPWTWWYAPAAAAPLLSKKELEGLASGGFLAGDGTPKSKRMGKNARKAYGILVTKLRTGAKVVERSASQLQILTTRNQELEKQLRIAREANGAAFEMGTLLEQIRASFKVPNSPANFTFNRLKPRKLKSNAGIPTLMCSDWHWGEVVREEQVEFLNSYNLDIAKERATRTFETALEVLFHHQSGMSYDGMVVSFGGDMFSGNIHEELRATNERPIHECLLDLTETLSSSIVRLAGEFCGLYIPCVSGNHGRIDFRPTAKNASVDNYDYLLYRMVQLQVQARMGSKCNVNFDISPSLDTRYGVYNTTYLLTHGDQANSSTKSDDFWASMMRLASRKQERNARGRSAGFDYMTVGHFHKYGTVSNIIVNGSLKGYCEWTYKNNYSFERPIQALWITHPHHKVTSHIPIYGDEVILDASSSMPPITTSSGLRSQR